VEIELGFKSVGVPDLIGCIASLDETASQPYLRLWATRDKQPLATSYTLGTDPVPDTIYAEGFEPGVAQLDWVLKPPTGPEISRDSVKFTVVKLDIDTDSDNTTIIDHTDAEDALEDVPGTGIGEVGKRIFINMDDDNRNGEPDVVDSKSDYLTHGLHDKDFAEIKLEALAVSGLAGYSLWLGVDAGLKAWDDDQKTELRNSPHPPDDGINLPWEPGYEPYSGTWYYWNIGSGGVSYPATLHVEGWLSGEREVSWCLVEPDGSGAEQGDIVARDAVEINNEWVVWPNQDASAVWNPAENTIHWNGFFLDVGWYIEKSLGQIINGDTGYIRTEYPEETASGRWEGTPDQNSNAQLDLAELCGTQTWEENETVRIELTYEFEQSPNITVGQFVDTTYSKYKEGFFHNSGVKIENRAEIQIYDTASLLDAIDNGHQGLLEGNNVTISDDPNNDIELTKQVLLQHTGSASGDWMAENVNALISGIPYQGVDEVEDPQIYGTYMAWLQSAPTGGQTMIIDAFRESDGEYTLVVTIDGHTRTYGNIPGSGSTDSGMLYLQSHWGSGVTFTSAKVKKL